MLHNSPPIPELFRTSPTETALSAQGSRGALTWLMALAVLLPIAGIPGEWVLQDTLKSTLLAAGVLLALAAWWLAQRRALGKGTASTWTWHGLLALPLVLMVCALLAMGWSHTYLAGVEAARWALLGLCLWIGLQTLRAGNAMRLVWAIHWGAVGACAWTAAQFWGDLAWFPQAAAPASTFVNRNFFAEYVVCTLPFSALALAQVASPRWRTAVALSVAFNLVALMMTGTRSALTALLVIALPLAVGLWRYRRALAWGEWRSASRTMVALMLLAGVVGLGSVPTRNAALLQEGPATTALDRSWQRTATMTTTKEYTAGSFSQRAAFWKSTARMWLDRPWIGVGAGAWEVYIALYQGPSADEEPDYYAHNEYLQLLAEYGLPVGGGVLAVLLAYLVIAARHTWRLPAHAAWAPLRVAALCSLLALLVVSLAGFPWRLASTGMLFMLCLALLAASDRDLALPDTLGGGTWPIGRTALWVAGLALLLSTVLATVVATQAIRVEWVIVSSIHRFNHALQLHKTDPATARRLHDEGVALVQEGMALNPHYRKLLYIPAEQLASLGDWVTTADVLQHIADSRPHIANVWSNLVLARIELKQADAAEAALHELARLQPNTARVRSMELLLLSRTGREAEAAEKIRDYFARGVVDFDATIFAYSLGLQLQQWDLVEQGLLLRAEYWPETAVDSYYRLGQAYVQAGAGYEARALQAFRDGEAHLPKGEVNNYLRQLPPIYRAQM
ncbi:MAG: O-antigen ligase family protein [Rhodoferax sp.]|nr:O-antigen ligase family protein [Rhodoferax sp.]